MPMSAFAATNDNTATTQTDTKTQVGTEADNTKESTPTNATAQDEDSSKAVEEEAKQAVDSLFTNNQYTALAKDVTEWHINTVEVTVHKVTNDQVKQDLQHKVDLARAFVAVNALFTPTKDQLAKGVTQAAIDAADAKVQALVASEGKEILKQDIEKAKAKLADSEKTKVTEEKATESTIDNKEQKSDSKKQQTKALISKKSLLQTKSLSAEEVDMSSYLSNLQVKYGSGDYVTVDGQEIPVALNSKLSFKADFDFSTGDLSEGSTLVYELPEGTYVDDGLESIPLIPEGGSTSIGTYSVKKVDGISRLEIILNDQYETLKNDSKGYITFDSYIGANFDGKSNEYDLTYPIGESSKTFTIKFEDKKPNPTTVMKKTATVDKVYNTSKVTYTIDVNKGYDEIQNFKLEDNLPAGLKYDSFSVKEYDYNRITGVESEQTTPSVTFTKGGNLTNLEFTASDSITKRYVFTVVTTVDNAALVDDENPNTDTIDKNTATVYDGLDPKQTATTPDNIIIKLADPITKHVKDYDSVNQTITWEIYYNFREETFPAGAAIINDYFSNNQSYVDGSLKAYEVTELKSSDNGVTPTFGSTPISDISVGMTPDASATLGLPFGSPNGIKISFTNEVNKAYVIQYKTKVDSQVIAGNEKAENVAYMGASPTISNAHTDINLSKTLTQGVGVKSNGNINYADKTIGWTITLNTDHTQDLNNVALTDTFSDTALELKEDSVKINGRTVDEYNSNNGSYPDITSVTKTADGFTLAFASGTIEHDLTITYETSFVARDLETNNYHNTLDIAFNGTTKTITTSTQWLSKISQDNGAKSGKYDYTNKQIDWTLDINYNQEALTNAQVVDTIVGQQKYLNNLDNLKIEEMSIDGSGNLHHTGTFLAKDTDYAISTVDESSNTFTITFNNPIDKQPYRITYSTVPTSQNILTGDNYKNSAQLNEDGGKNTSYAEAYPIINGGSTSTDPDNNNPTKDTGIIEKTMTRATNSRVLNWTVWVNKSQTVIGNTHFIDTPSDNQTLIRDSIKITPYKYDNDGQLQPDGGPISKDITYTGNMFDIDFGDIHSTYKVEYSTYFDGDSGDEAGNDAHLNGTGALANKEASIDKKQINYNSLSAGLYTTNKAYLTVHKVGAIQGTTSASDILLSTLVNATFELYDDSKTVKLAEGTTDVQGNLTFDRKLSAGIYYLKETNLDNTDYNINTSFIKIEVTKDTIMDVENGVGKVDQTVKNYLKSEKEPNTCTVTFINKDGNDDGALTGSEYKVIKQKVDAGDPEEVVIENVQADSTGKITVSKLPAGDYTLVQTKLPDGGYDTLAKPTDFKVVEGSCTTADIVVKNSKLCNTVTVNFNAVDPSDMAGFRNGSKFKVVDSNDDIAKDKDNNELKDLTLDSDNKLTFNKLPDGEYKIIQTDTPDGYVKIDDISFNTTDFDDACQKIIPVTIEKCDTFANFEVVGATGQQATDLANQAEFKVVDSNGDDVAGATGLKVVDGKVNVPDLSPGTYKLVQTKAPAGYYAASPQEFVVSADTCTSLITVKNYQIPSAPTPTCPIEFNVVDSKTNNGIGNATFEVKQNGVTVATVTSDTSGKVSLPALTVGDYQLVQTSSKAGYEFNKEPISFSVKNDNGTCTVTISTVKNDPKTCPVDITVIDADATNIKVAGATFTIKDKDGKVVAENVTFDKDGKIIVKGLVAGDYTLVQTSVPNGYEKSADVSFTVKTKEDGTCENTVVVVKNVPKQCDVVFINKDEETGKVVKGSSTFVVKDQDGKTVTTVTSDSNGKITVAHLKPGTYELVQQKAPSGYEEQSGTITFTVKKGECGPNIVIDNVKVDEPKDPKNDNNKGNGKTPNKNKDEDTPSPNNNKASKSGNNSATFKVTDKDHAHKYKDDVYKLVDENGKTIASGLKVNKDGNIVVEGLPDGDYHLVKLPQTGVQNSLYASLMGLVLVLLGGYAIYRGRRKKSIM